MCEVEKTIQEKLSMRPEDRPNEEQIGTEPRMEEPAAAQGEEAANALTEQEEEAIAPALEEDILTEQEESASSPEEVVNAPSELEEIVQPPVQRRPVGMAPKFTLVTTLLLFLATALAVGLPSFFLSRHTPEQTIYKSMSLADPLLTRPYAATAPGSRCDLGGARWAIGQYFKAASSSQETVFDATSEMSCKSDGLLVTKKDHFGDYTTLVFEDRDSTALPHHFKTQISATILSSQKASIELGVRVQKPAATANENSGYGNDTLTVCEDGTWEVRRVGDTSGTVATVLAHGTVQPTKAFTLAAEVNGPVMAFSINEHVVATVSDITYPTSHGISFGVVDPTAKAALSALFSHFTYTPLSQP
jgi:hypothetical protein